MRLLLAEDEKELAKALGVILRHNNYSVDIVHNGEDALCYLENGDYDGAILDIMMPEIDGLQILSKLRSEAAYKDIPVIMATAKGTEMDKIGGLNSGADDYLVKPFGVMEMVARVKAVLRRTAKQETTNDITVGNITLKEAEHQVVADGERVELTYKEFEILKLFMHNPNMVFSRDKLMSEIWGMDYIGETRTVDMHIKTLRHKLRNAGGQIKTVIGVGYRLEKEV